MERVAKFELVSLKEFQRNFSNDVFEIYTKLRLPARATKYSAGYDFYSPFDFCLKPGKSIIIPTGIKVNMRSDYFLMLVPRSGLGFKFKLQLDNTLGVIDADYYYSKNEGHIFVKITNDNRENSDLHIKRSDAFIQGVFLKFGITNDDEAKQKRDGGLGSTTIKSEKNNTFLL